MDKGTAAVRRRLATLVLSASLFLFPVFLRAESSNAQVDVIKTSRGELRIRPLYHGSVMLEFAGKVIHVSLEPGRLHGRSAGGPDRCDAHPRRSPGSHDD
jgi:hypothetical protein